MRTIKELLELVLEKREEVGQYCICDTFLILQDDKIITTYEFYLLQDFMEENRPKHIPRYEYTMWWPEGEWEPRIEWLREQIKILEKNESTTN